MQTDDVMQGEVAYRQLVLTEKGEEKLRLPLTAPVNDMLGWLATPTSLRNYVTYMGARYGGLGLGRLRMEHAAGFLDAAKAATKGHLSADIAEHVGRLRFAPDGTVAAVPDFPALAAWSLMEAVRRQELRLLTCPTCKRKWLASSSEKSRYCQRWAPGQTRDCRTLEYERHVAGDAAYSAYRREYKRLAEAERRGSVEGYAVRQWRAQNSATDWQPFEEWKAQRKEEANG
jgi:hypothetical protein